MGINSQNIDVCYQYCFILMIFQTTKNRCKNIPDNILRDAYWLTIKTSVPSLFMDGNSDNLSWLH